MVGQHAGQAGARHTVMRELNRSLVLDLVKQSSPTSRAAIAKATSLAKPTVSVIVDDLLSQGVVREVGVGSTTSEGGRPPVLLEFNALSQCLVGVHVGVTTTTVVLADARGRELHRRSMPTGTGRAGRVLERIAKTVQSVVEQAGLGQAQLAVGVCLPGLTDVASGACLLAPNLGWRDVPVREILHRLLDVPVYVHNTSQAAAVAEVIEGAARGSEDVILLYLGTGVGSGLLMGGRLFHGSDGLAGEIGHCKVTGSVEPCTCGGTGCLEAVASGLSLARDAARAVAAGRETVLTKELVPLGVEHVAAAARRGDALASELLMDAGRQIGIAASWLVNLVNPEVLVLAGGLVEVGDPLLDPLRESIRQHALSQVAARVSVRTSTLGADAEVRGAVLLAMQYSETYYRVVFQGG